MADVYRLLQGGPGTQGYPHQTSWWFVDCFPTPYAFVFPSLHICMFSFPASIRSVYYKHKVLNAPKYLLRLYGPILSAVLQTLFNTQSACDRTSRRELCICSPLRLSMATFWNVRYYSISRDGNVGNDAREDASITYVSRLIYETEIIGKFFVTSKSHAARFNFWVHQGQAAEHRLLDRLATCSGSDWSSARWEQNRAPKCILVVEKRSIFQVSGAIGVVMCWDDEIWWDIWYGGGFMYLKMWNSPVEPRALDCITNAKQALVSSNFTAHFPSILMTGRVSL